MLKIREYVDLNALEKYEFKKNTNFYDVIVGDIWFGYDYEDNSHLVDKKIEELENELERRNENNGF